MSLAPWFERFSAHPDRLALLLPEAEIRYGDLLRAIDLAKGKLKELGLVCGDVLAVGNHLDKQSLAMLVAGADLGLILLPFADLPAEAVESRFRILPPQAIWKKDAIRKTQDAQPQHPLLDSLRTKHRPGLVLFSSGSTGEPKAMVRDFQDWLEPMLSRKPRSLKLLTYLLFDHIGGLNTIFNALAGTNTLVLPSARDAHSVARAIAQHKVDILPASPSFLNLLLVSGATEDHDLSSLRIITYGTEPMPDELLHRLHQSFPKTRFIQTFGTSETGIATTRSSSQEGTWFQMDGKDESYKIVEGELWLKGSGQVAGYLNADSSAFTKDGWFRTQDRVEERTDGWLKILGRLSDQINIGGEKVFPSEIESALLSIPEIQAARVYGAPNAITGHTVAADLVLRPDATLAETKRIIRRTLRTQLENFKIPTRIHQVDTLNLTTRGKRAQ